MKYKLTIFPRRHFQTHFLARILFRMSVKFVAKVWTSSIRALVQIIGWGRPGDKPLSIWTNESLPTQICIPRPQWVKQVPIQKFVALFGFAWTCPIQYLRVIFQTLFLQITGHFHDVHMEPFISLALYYGLTWFVAEHDWDWDNHMFRPVPLKSWRKMETNNFIEYIFESLSLKQMPTAPSPKGNAVEVWE